MKKILWMLFAALMVAFTACDDSEDLVFEHEYPMFELKEGAILLEVLMPAGTAQEDELYIVGDFNGGEENAVGNLMWQMIPSTNQHKWGIYLYPETFAAGKTLADGYYFYSKQDGKERSVKNEDIYHYDTANPGERVNNLMVSRWESFFLQDGPAIEHDGYVVYVIDETSWGGQLAMYAWGDAEAFGGWPGMQPTGQEVVADVMYTYFDLGESNTGLNLNLIFNNNGGGSQLADVNVTVNQDYFFRLTDDGVEPLEGEPLPATDGYAIFVDNQAGWEAMALYVWGGALGNDGLGGWPGMQPTGTYKKKGVTYTYFDLGAANNGKDGNFILNDNGAGNQTPDMPFVMDQHHFVRINADLSWVEVDPENPDATEPVDPVDPVPPTPADGYSIYVDDQTGWDAIAVHVYNDGYSTQWPGYTVTETVTEGDVTYKRFVAESAINNQAVNLIFNNNGGGIQLADYPVTLNKDLYLKVTAEGVEDVTPVNAGYSIYVDDQTGWDAIAVHVYNNSYTTTWPGYTVAETVTEGNVTYKRFVTEAVINDQTVNLIFNNNGGGTQLADYPVTLNKDLYLKVTAEGVEDITATPPTEVLPTTAGPAIFVYQKAAWEVTNLYVYGGTLGNNGLGDWPGMAPTGTCTYKGATYTYFDLGAANAGKDGNFIVNNNSGTQVEIHLTMDANRFVRINADGTICTIDADDPDAEIVVLSTYTIYAKNETGLADLYMYCYGSGAAQDCLGGWPGTKGKPVTVDGTEYVAFAMPDAVNGLAVNPIFSDGKGGDTGWQFDAPQVTVTRDFYFQVTTTAVTEITK